MSALSRRAGTASVSTGGCSCVVRWEFAPPAADVDRPPFEHIDNALKAGVLGAPGAAFLRNIRGHLCPSKRANSCRSVQDRYRPAAAR